MFITTPVAMPLPSMTNIMTPASGIFLCACAIILMILAVRQLKNPLIRQKPDESPIGVLVAHTQQGHLQQKLSPDVPEKFLTLDFVTMQLEDEQYNYHELEAIVLEPRENDTYRVMANGHQMLMPGVMLTPDPPLSK